MRLYYAQNKEDLLIGSFFPDVAEGFYIDVGANDPVLDSVTKLFYDKGWRGINIEPIQQHFDALNQQRPRDINLQIGLGSKPDKLTFTEYPEGDGLSTFDDSMQKFYEETEHGFPTARRKQYEVEVKTLQDVIADITPPHIHFIKIDVEGYEYEVINGYDWKGSRPELICIEANHIHKDWRPILKRNKYHEVFFDGINTYYLAEESLHRKELFNYPDAAFAGNPVYYRAYLETEAETSYKLAGLQKIIADKEQEIAFLHRQQRDVRFLAKRLAVETQLRLNKRAQGVKASEHLYYQSSSRVTELLESEVTADKQRALAEIHALDKQNIHKRQAGVKDKLKPLVWKAAAGGVSTSIRMVKKARHGK